MHYGTDSSGLNVRFEVEAEFDEASFLCVVVDERVELGTGVDQETEERSGELSKKLIRHYTDAPDLYDHFIVTREVDEIERMRLVVPIRSDSAVFRGG